MDTSERRYITERSRGEGTQVLRPKQTVLLAYAAGQAAVGEWGHYWTAPESRQESEVGFTAQLNESRRSMHGVIESEETSPTVCELW